MKQPSPSAAAASRARRAEPRWASATRSGRGGSDRRARAERTDALAAKCEETASSLKRVRPAPPAAPTTPPDAFEAEAEGMIRRFRASHVILKNAGAVRSYTRLLDSSAYLYRALGDYDDMCPNRARHARRYASLRSGARLHSPQRRFGLAMRAWGARHAVVFPLVVPAASPRHVCREMMTPRADALASPCCARRVDATSTIRLRLLMEGRRHDAFSQSFDWLLSGCADQCTRGHFGAACWSALELGMTSLQERAHRLRA